MIEQKICAQRRSQACFRNTAVMQSIKRSKHIYILRYQRLYKGHDLSVLNGSSDPVCAVYTCFMLQLLATYSLSINKHFNQCFSVSVYHMRLSVVCWCVRLLHSDMSRLAVVCGGSRGIGRAVSRLLAQRGCRVAVVSRGQDAARATVASLHGGTVMGLGQSLF